MKKVFFCFAILGLTILACKKNTDGGGSEGQSASELVSSLQAIGTKFAEIGEQTNGSAQQVLALTYEWVKTQPNVKSAELYDSLLLCFELASGLRGCYHLDLVDDMGFPLYRGGGGSGGGWLKSTAGSVEITNRNVLIVIPYEEFYNQTDLNNLLAIFAASSKQFNVRLVKGSNCKPALIDSMAAYGLVIFDSHGAPDGILFGGKIDASQAKGASEEKLKTMFDSYGGTGTFDRIFSGDIKVTGSSGALSKQPKDWKQVIGLKDVGVMVTSKWISATPKLKNTVVFANTCYSGYRKTSDPRALPIQPAFMSLDPISYYCYFDDKYGDALPVSNKFAKNMEDTLLRALIIKFDSTGQANLKHDGSEFVDPDAFRAKFKHDGHDGYSFDVCGASMTDPRDGNVYKTVCIGDQRWMAENLRFTTPLSRCYDNNPANCDFYGRLYNFGEAVQNAAPSSTVPSGIKGVCPNGWHLPSKGEWVALINTLGGLPAARPKLMSVSPAWTAPDPNADNSSGFSALPGGLADTVLSGATEYFSQLGAVANFWTSSDSAFGGGRQPVLFQLSAVLQTGFQPANTTVKASCRCVQDK